MLERHHPLIVSAGGQQQFEAQRLAGFFIDPLLPLQNPTRFIQQLSCLEQIFAVEAVAVRGRRLINGGEDLRRQFVFQWPEQEQFIGVRIAAGGVLGVLKIAVGAAVSVIEQRFVHPLKIKRQADRLTHPTVGKYWSLDVKGEPAGILRGIVLLLIFHDITAGKVFANIAGGPVFGAALGAHVIGSRLKGLEGDIIIQIVVVAQRVEIPAPAVNR